MHRLLPFCLAGLACTGAPAAAAEQVVPYPAAQALSAARDARDIAAAKVAANGWTKAADPYVTPVGELVRFGFGYGLAVLGCRTYDVGETCQVDAAAATTWAGRKPDQLVQRAELAKFTWEPGLSPGEDSFEIFYVPAGSPLIALVKVSGIAIKADQVSDLPR